MNTPTLDTWKTRLEQTAAIRLGRLPHGLPGAGPQAEAFIRGFRDDAGHRRPVDAPFLSHVLEASSPIASAATTPDCELWNQVCLPASRRDETRINAMLESHAAALALPLREEGIEIWTEAELGALHALTWLGHRDRATAAAQFLIEELQPDNGTNRPWSIHWFAMLEIETGDRYAGMYAETLLHNALADGGVPDLLSALIMHDSARWLAMRA